MELAGKIKVIFEEKTFPSGFNKREFVITTEEQYPNDIIFELIKDKTSSLNNFKAGDRVVVRFDIKGNEYQGKYYNNLRAWKVDAAGNGPQESVPPPPPSMEDYASDTEDDLPF